MGDESPTLEVWRRLYAAASQIKTLEPWKWMTEADMFGVEDPDSGDLGFVSVMGMLGEHHAISVYLGAEALYDFLDFEETAPYVTHSAGAARVISMRQVQASFEDREMQEKEDRAIIKQLGLKFRGRGAWPLFRSYEAGLVPWFLTAAEVRLLTHALEQLAVITPHFIEDDLMLDCEEDEQFLVRVPCREGDRLVWTEEIRHIPPPMETAIPVLTDAALFQTFKKLPQHQLTVEIDCFMLLTPIQDRARPYYPFVLLMVAGENGMILGFDLLTSETTLEALWGSVPLKIIQHLAGVGVRPTRIRVTNGRLFQVLKGVAETVGVKLEFATSLPTLEEAKAELIQHMIYGGMVDDEMDFDLLP